jgi:hypothetical protein
MKDELVISLRSKVFGDRGTDVMAAFDYAETIINGLSESSDRGPAWTAVHVLANTIANAIEALPQYVDRIEFLPAPPAEVQIAPDNPAAGITDLESAILRLIDARITQSPSLGDRINGQVSRCVDEMLGDAIDDIVHAKIDVKIEEALDDFADNRLDDEIQKYLDNSVDFTEIVRDEIRQNITFTVEVE